MSQLLSDIATRLALFSDTPTLDASVLLAHVIEKPRTWVMAHPELVLNQQQQEKLNEAMDCLDKGEAFPYIIGKWEFFGLEFNITKDVLIPRPETELLVEKAIAWLNASPEKRNIADIGTGSGAIAVALAEHIPNAHITATDISSAALEVAKGNAHKFNVENRINFIECDLLPDSKVKGQKSNDLRPATFDLICANLPYIPTQTLHQLSVYEREPTLALDGGADGLDIFRKLLNIAPQWLAPYGMILLEIESSQGMKALSIAYDTFANASIHLYKDLNGHDRLLEISLS